MSVNRKLLFFNPDFSTIHSAVFALPTARNELTAAVVAAAVIMIIIMSAAARVKFFLTSFPVEANMHADKAQFKILLIR